MPLLFGDIGYRMLKRLDAKDRLGSSEPPQTLVPRESKISRYLGKQELSFLRGKNVLDFGCGGGHDVLDIAEAGAKRVVGLDIRENVLKIGRDEAAKRNLQNVEFTTKTKDQFDVILSMDAMEHFSEPLDMLKLMAARLTKSGQLWIVFGPPWLHPLGGHLFSIFPWSHLIFSEYALCKWRSEFKNDGATKICEVEGGLNKMTIRRFESLIDKVNLQLDSMKCIPIRPVHFFHSRFTREFFTSIVVCKLSKQ